MFWIEKGFDYFFRYFMGVVWIMVFIIYVLFAGIGMFFISIAEGFKALVDMIPTKDG